MKKKLLLLTLLLLTLTACSENDVPITSIGFGRSMLHLYVGETETLTVFVNPEYATNQRAVWTSSNTDVATVDNNGLVTAISVGTTTITVTMANGNFTATCEVTVTPAPIITGVILGGQTSRRLVIGATERFSAHVIPHYAINRVTWTSSNPNVATVSTNGVVTAVSTGTTTITATTVDGSHTATGTITVVGTVNISSSLGGVVIDGIRWATRNVAAPGTFAQRPTDTGMFYQWNRRQGWTDGFVAGWNETDAVGTEWARSNDPCPTGWRVPTVEELTRLQEASSGWITRNGVNGRVFGTASNQLFLPAAGVRNSGLGLSAQGYDGSYWSSTPTVEMAPWGSEVLGASFLYFNIWHVATSNTWRSRGVNVRCVAE